MNFDRPHRRYNPLTGEWLLVSPHRARRPWQGQVEKKPPEERSAYDPNCYLCPGNPRAEGARNPLYTGTFVFDNDFAALLPPEPGDKLSERTDGLFVAEAENGLCRVVCFSERHDLSVPSLSQGEMEAVVRAWTEQTLDLAAKDFISYVQVFENNGAMMGASSPHPHSQIWAETRVPNEPAKELARQEAYALEHRRCLLCDVLEAERRSGERVVVANEHFTALVPFWAVWPFETLLIANRHCGGLPDLTEVEASGLADIMRRLTTRYDNLFETSFPYSMGFHQAPFDGQRHDSWHFHAHYYPPLLRSATVRKFMVGYELLANPQRDLTPETAAARLREVSEIYYRLRYE